MSEADSITAHTHVTTHVVDGVALLPHQFHRGGDVDALAASWLAEVQEAEDAAWSILGATLEAATGDALDQLGELLVWPRGSLSDADYRAVLSVVVKCNRSAGTGDELLAILEDVMASTGFALTEYFPAALVAEPEAAPSLGVELLHLLLKRAKAGGVKLHTIALPVGGAFRLSPGERVTTDADHGLSDTGGTTGGALAGVLA